MSKFIVITKNDQAIGFRLAGIHAIGTDDIHAVNNLITNWLEKKEKILLALDDDLFSKLDQCFINRIYASDELLLVTIPSGSISSADESRKKRIYEMIRHATGVQIKFKGE